MKKRLFVSTGSISLINVLAIIEQTKTDEDFQDTLAIISFAQSEEFINSTNKIAGLHKFINIVYFKKERELLNTFNFDDFDIVYSSAFPKFYSKLNKHKFAYVYEEGPGSARSNISTLNSVKGFFITPYINKFSYMYSPKNANIQDINKETFYNISKKIIQLFNENENLETEKNVLFIGHYVYRKLGDNVALDFYKKYISYFIEKGYTVYFKGHPRDNDVILPQIKEFYNNEDKLKFLNNSLPIEIYDYNFDIITGAYSGTLVSIPHFRNIPSINLPLKDLYYAPVGLGFKKFFALYDEYCPSLEEMEDVIGKSKDKIQERYWEIINSKIDLDKHEKLKEIFCYRPNVVLDVICGFVGLFCNEKNKLKIKNFGRRSFYKKIDEFFSKK